MSFAALLAVADVAIRDVLGSSVIYTPSVGSPVTVTGVFDAAYVRVDAGTPGVSSSGPAVFLTISTLTSNPETDLTATVTISSVVYSVHECQPDGMGGVLLHLHRV